jgi:hypothetical protein
MNVFLQDDGGVMDDEGDVERGIGYDEQFVVTCTSITKQRLSRRELRKLESLEMTAPSSSS